MKFSSAIKILLIAVIFLQSFMSVANSSVPHQLDIEHLQTVHDHSADNHTSSSNLDDDHDINDCHHCGHCSGNHSTWILLKVSSTNLLVKEQGNFNKFALSPINIPDSLYRPPKA